jgi:hypothetical protein
MNSRQEQLAERDVRKDTPDLDPNEFLRLYLSSNFPQTAAFQSAEQRERGVIPQDQMDDVIYKKKPPSGTSFDNPARS